MAKKNRALYLIFAFLFIFYSNSRDCFANSLWRKIENRAFKVGEKLIYTVKWEGIAGGTSVLEVKKIVKISGRDAYYVTLTTRTSGFFDIFYKIRDLVESYIDKEGIFTWKQRKRLREGKYRSDRVTIYDQVNQQALYKGKKVDIPFYVQDSLSSFYYLRTQELKKGDSIIMDVNEDGKNYLVEVKVTGIENIYTPAGEFTTVKTEGVLKSGRKNQEHGSRIWFSNDERKIPVKIERESKFGTITMVLKEAIF